MLPFRAAVFAAVASLFIMLSFLNSSPPLLLLLLLAFLSISLFAIHVIIHWLLLAPHTSPLFVV